MNNFGSYCDNNIFVLFWSQDFFGVQVCGCSPPQMARVAQLLEETVECDFVDINMGCPIGQHPSMPSSPVHEMPLDYILP